jgi:YidC/Oxa1 family membrane protein insertase
MDKNTIIGLILIFALLMGWQQYMKPKAQAIEAQKALQDSLARATQVDKSKPATRQNDTVSSNQQVDSPLDETIVQTASATKLGPFAPAGIGKNQELTLENDLIKIVFNSKGGVIRYAELKKYYKVDEDDRKKELKSPLRLLANDKNRFEYRIPVKGAANGLVKTGDLYFDAQVDGNTIVFKANAGEGRYFEQKYTLSSSDYSLDYAISAKGLSAFSGGESEDLKLYWLNYLDKLEKNEGFERNYSTVYFRPTDDSPDYCACTSSDTEDKSSVPIRWIAHANQFFNTSIVAEKPFKGAVMETEMLDPSDSSLKKLRTELTIPAESIHNASFTMKMYLGPNEFDRLRAMGYNLEDVIPFGASILGSINRWVVRPVFNFLLQFISSKGLVILLLTFLVKMVVYPLTYRMLYSQAKMGALKPQLAGLKDKFKDDPQQQQVETMKIYREFGVNPLGGCLPSLLQMPIWIALYRFFPAAIEFRQASFLWATDLSSYDVAMRLPFEIPMGFGSHISAFTLLWAISTLVYTYYSTRDMDFSANPAMKYMQYIMPLLFLGFFNSYASGLTCYLLFSNLITIGQTIVTRNYIIDKEKIMAQLEAYRKQPKKKGGWQDRLESAMKEQQRIQTEKAKQAQQKNKK